MSETSSTGYSFMFVAFVVVSVLVLFILLTVMIRAGLSAKQKLARGETSGWGMEMGRKEIWNIWKYDNPLPIRIEACVEKFPSNCFVETTTTGTFPCPAQETCPEIEPTRIYDYPDDADETVKEIIDGVNARLMDKSGNSCGDANTKTFFTTVLMRLNGRATMEEAHNLVESLYNTKQIPEHIKTLLSFIETEKDGIPMIDREKLSVVYSAVTNLSMDECYKIFGMYI